MNNQPLAHNYRLITVAFALAVGNFAVGMAAFLEIGFLDRIASDMSVSTADSGLVMAVYAASYAISSPLLITMTRRSNRRYVLLAALLILFVGVITTALAPNWNILLLGRVITAFGGGLFTPTASSLVFALSSEETRGKMLGWVFFGLSISQAVGLPLGVLARSGPGWRMGILGVAIIAIVAFIATWIVLPRQYAPEDSSQTTTFWPDKKALLGTMLMLLHIAAMATVFTFITPLIILNGSVSPLLVMMVFGGSNMFGALFVGRITDRYGSEPVILVLLLIHLAILPVFSWTNAPAYLIVLLAILWGGFAGAFMVPQQFRLLRLAPNSRNVILSVNASMNYIGFASGSFIGGIVIRELGIASLGIVGSMIAAVALLWFWLVR